MHSFHRRLLYDAPARVVGIAGQLAQVSAHPAVSTAYGSATGAVRTIVEEGVP
jgi:hypothetical protein